MFRIGLFVALVVLASCSTTRVIKPLDKGEKQIGASFGGPAIIFSGAPIPLPLTSISYAHGLDTGLTLAGGLHTTALLFGNAEIDLSLGIRVFESNNERFGLTASPGVHLFYGFRGNAFRAYPQLEGIGWWQYGEKNHLLYGGLGTWVELVREKAHSEVQQHELMPYVTLGHQFAGAKWKWQVEARYIGFNYSTDNIVVEYLGPFPNGTTGLYVGLTRKLGKQ
ncbi:MAG: hypothetical protein RLP15_02585 [Cryomorphaceae bacterium]